jgi:hypothetical protein
VDRYTKADPSNPSGTRDRTLQKIYVIGDDTPTRRARGGGGSPPGGRGCSIQIGPTMQGLGGSPSGGGVYSPRGSPPPRLPRVLQSKVSVSVVNIVDRSWSHSWRSHLWAPFEHDGGLGKSGGRNLICVQPCKTSPIMCVLLSIRARRAIKPVFNRIPALLKRSKFQRLSSQIESLSTPMSMHLLVLANRVS